MNVDYIACECCGKMARDDEIWNGVRNNKTEVCIHCHDKELAEIEQENRNACECRNGCNACLMLER